MRRTKSPWHGCLKVASDVNALLEYSELMGKYADFAAKADAYDSNEMSTADAQYYIEVTARIEKRLLETSASIG